MQRKPTKNTRGPNTEEKRFQGWLKEHSCAWCGKPGPCIVDHARGATFRHNKVLVGHWFCIPQCYECDQQKTLHGKRLGNESEKWLELEAEYWIEHYECAPEPVRYAIEDWGR